MDGGLAIAGQDAEELAVERVRVDGETAARGAAGDVVAILNAGAYHQAMSSTHCLRPAGTAVFLSR